MPYIIHLFKGLAMAYIKGSMSESLDLFQFGYCTKKKDTYWLPAFNTIIKLRSVAQHESNIIEFAYDYTKTD